MSNTPLDVRVLLEMFTAQGIHPTVAKAYVVLHNGQHVVYQEGGRVRGREVAIHWVEGQRKEGEIVCPAKFVGHVVAISEQTTSRQRVLLQEPRIETVDVDH